ncbi:Peroxiredoxin-2, putative [Perkinsus marinus ATCC 50983]|uniref:Peroxiredoxin-2, putative n=1 Tax=Perkinsus marinus (strain ATCC 50983 / TXsc) TaxID=423536 RepID=C5LZ36_PERM5|nr:Peroxiredoxin-2, putative [Perkinsus marinus ATCC 50983]EEQ98045.1 Peroxiredoxin-2, putative [Perkinsus marinus ATCC 50983]|eukprot:XP_002765328.1 Peroxiredoxin-2, putative [Perkinsus marinus ATCC 50983]
MFIQQSAPDFDLVACMPDDSFKHVKLSDYKGKYVVLFFYPGDFTFVCASEVIGFHEKMAEFEKRGAVVLACSTDSADVHKAWKHTEKKNGGIGTQLCYPMLSDHTQKMSREYDVLLENDGVALRGVFIIGKDGTVRSEMKNDLPLGRNVDEVLRILDTVIETDEHGVVCPMNWKKGLDTMIPTTEGVANYLLKHTN